MLKSLPLVFGSTSIDSGRRVAWLKMWVRKPLLRPVAPSHQDNLLANVTVSLCPLDCSKDISPTFIPHYNSSSESFVMISRCSALGVALVFMLVHLIP